MRLIVFPVCCSRATILDPCSRILVATWQAADGMVVADLDGTLLEHASGLLERAAVMTGIGEARELELLRGGQFDTVLHEPGMYRL